MKNLVIFGLMSCLLGFWSCRTQSNPTPVSNAWTYSGSGDGNIGTNNNVVITFPIQSNLNVNGVAQLSNNAVVNNDLNLNLGGKVVVITTHITDTVYLNGNVNVNDSLFINRGIVKVARDFNINSKGFVNCSDSARVIIGGSLNQAGTLWGNTYIKATTKNINNPNQTFANPY